MNKKQKTEPKTTTYVEDGILWEAREYEDADGDGFGTFGGAQTACESPEGYAGVAGDRDAADGAVHPGAEETGAGAGENANLNLPLPEACSNEEYLANLDRGLEAIGAFGGSTLVVSLGIDTYGRDPICDLALTTEAYHEVGRRAAALGRTTIVLQEGGYFLPHLGENVRNWLLGIEGRELDLSALPEV